ncbi:carbohydrate ABC transporter permease [Alicyclobacillus vulcanalis]|uniref:Carbohydrate ABC transporter membrane protein 2, CUT1 family n=1 Tax=Alicyclobacillus vulcanalis TaxID=252246 RepID=A0A1N7LMG9_9BACL|nr:carbohydrate ABC transporter permease [Alicyclobacillus vulcanalis]SIS75007.1 carbohydrate ABC transporter membrane protein 2, CUT1 family [Alicyclobacillus vulcanalis]
MRTRIAGNLTKYVVAILIALIMFFPIIWIISNSLQTESGISSYPPQIIPKNPQFSNYAYILHSSNLLVYFRNTLILIIGNTLGTLISSSLVAYPLARMDFAGKKVIFVLVLATMMVPSTATIIPQFIFFSKIGWINSFLPLIVPAFFAYPYNVFLFRQFYRTIPAYIYEAAQLDGCNHWTFFSRIIVPLAKPIFITVGILSSIFWWNELFTPLIYINNDNLKPLSVGALSLFTTQYTTEYNLEMAFSVFMIIPPILLYLFGQRYLVEGIKTSGGK